MTDEVKSEEIQIAGGDETGTQEVVEPKEEKVEISKGELDALKTADGKKGEEVDRLKQTIYSEDYLNFLQKKGTAQHGNDRLSALSGRKPFGGRLLRGLRQGRSPDHRRAAHRRRKSGRRHLQRTGGAGRPAPQERPPRGDDPDRAGRPADRGRHCILSNLPELRRRRHCRRGPDHVSDSKRDRRAVPRAGPVGP